MRVRLLLLSASLALLGSCASAPSVATRGPKIGLAASLPDALYLHKGGFAPAPPPGDIAIIYDTDSTVKTVDSNATKTALGGGGGGFGTPFSISQPNSAAANFQTWQFTNNFTNNTSGSETANVQQSVPINGVQTFFDPSAVNSAGASRQTTSGATPSQAMPLRSDVLLMKLGADVTSLTVTGLDIDVDVCYRVIGMPVISAGNNVVTADLNGTTSGYVALGYFIHSTLSTAALTRFQVFDNSDVGTTATFEATICGATGAAKVYRASAFYTDLSPTTWIDNYQGTSTITADVTSIVFNGAMKAGTIIAFERLRTSAN